MTKLESKIINNSLFRNSMPKSATAYLIVMVLLALPMAGCLEEEVAEGEKIEAEELIEVDDPCSLPSESILQSMTTIQAHGVDRYFRLTVPSSDSGTKLPIVLAFHGGGGAEEERDRSAHCSVRCFVVRLNHHCKIYITSCDLPQICLSSQ